MLSKPSSLQQRTALYILAPTLLILLTMGILGFRSIETMLIDQVTYSAGSHQKRTAIYIDTRLQRPKIILSKLTTAPNDEVYRYLLDILTSLNGVLRVQYTSTETNSNNHIEAQGDARSADNYLRYFTKATYLPSLASNTVSLISRQKDSSGRTKGFIEVTISFYDLIGHIPEAPWWTGLRTFLIDHQGNILAPDSFVVNGHTQAENFPLATMADLKEKLLAAILQNDSGAVFSDNTQLPDTIYGFSTLTEAPWTMVVSSSGATILRPITAFRHAYFLAVFFTIVVILFLLRFLTARTIKTVQQVSSAATRLAKGHFDSPLQVQSKDELGELITSFNSMSMQLQQGIQLKNSMALAGEVQRNLLPQACFKSRHIEAIGVSIPSDETGGDFFDLIDFKADDHRLTVVVGDVVGHGIGAALLMATTRAFVRSRLQQPGTLADSISDVNNLLCRDTESSGNFVTVFLLAITRTGNEITWVRAGHEPAIVYNLKEKSFSNLKGNGVALGIDKKRQYTENNITLPTTPHIVLIGTDGVTDLENSSGERFGKQRLQSFIAKYGADSSERILENLCRELTDFRGNERQNDDITFVILKTD